MHHPALEELLEYMDGELASSARTRVGLHLEGCAECRERLSSLSMASSEVGEGYAVPSVSREGMAEQGAQLRARLNQVADAGPASKQDMVGWAKSLAYAAALFVLSVTAVAFFVHPWKASEQKVALPNPAFTPGATRQVSLNEICSADDDEVVRSVPASVQQRVFREYGLMRAQPGDFEVDYLITPGLGGSDDVMNLWPQPHGNQWNSYVKDQLEDHLHHMVCRGELPLAAAQHAIASNWIAAYQKYFQTDRPLAESRRTAPEEARSQRLAWPR